jgi:hypothetical protein
MDRTGEYGIPKLREVITAAHPDAIAGDVRILRQALDGRAEIGLW